MNRGKNPCTGAYSEFNKMAHDMVELYDIPYDYASVMHYRDRDFVKAGMPADAKSMVAKASFHFLSKIIEMK